MTVRLTHRQKPDTQNYIFQALGSPFSLTGIAASLRTGFRMSVPDKIPYIYTGYSASVSKLPPVWGTLSSYQITEGVAVSAQALPVTVSGGGNPTITVAWHSSSVPSTKPSWVTLTSGTAPTIAFTGDANQIDSADVSSMVLSAVANGSAPVLSSPVPITVIAAPTGSISVLYSSAQGSAVGPTTVGIYWQSSFATKDGRLIEWGTSDHGPHQDNGVREYDPVTKTQSYVFNRQTYGTYAGVVPSLNPGGPAFPIGGIPITQYDNHHYYYIPRIDSLVIPSRGQYRRANNDWPLSYRYESTAEGVDVGVSAPATATYVSGLPGDTRELWWKGSIRLTSTTTGALFRPLGTGMDETAELTEFESDFNPHQAWSEQFDCGVRIAGASGGGSYTDRPYLWVTAPSGNFGSYSQPYVTYRASLPSSVGGGPVARLRGRDGCCFVGPWVYWVGGDTSVSTRTLFRLNITPYLTTAYTSVISSGLGSIEKLSDAPWDLQFGLLRHDPYSNALLLVCAGGVAMYDLRDGTWSIITPSGYTSFFSGTSSLPNGCVGDFINERTQSGTSTLLRQFYWRAGGPDSIGINTTQKQRFHSLKITRPTDAISYLTVESRNPESPASIWGDQGIGPLADCKHISITERSGYLYLFGGDWDDSYPYNSNTTSGYKPEGIISQNGRQEIWRCSIADAVSTGKATWYLSGNAYAEYPYVSGAGNGYYSTATHGPYQPDGLGCFTDSSGQLWMGPCDVGYTDLDGYEIAGQKNTYAPMFKWTPPGTNNTAVTGAGIDGVALGNGWTLPSQDRLAFCLGSGSSPVGTAGVDYDYAFATGSCVGWGRPNKGPAYDSSDNKARVIAVQGFNSSGTYYVKVSVFAFNCTPDGGSVHRWVKTDSPNIPVQNIGGPPQAVITGINTTWGTGGIGNTCQIGRRLYASFVCTYSVTAGYGNRDSTTLVKVVILSINLDNLSDITHVPLPAGTNWWLRTLDGPEGAEAHSLGYAPLTPGQYRSMVAVNNRLVLGPERWHKIGVDPLFSVYNPATGLWKTSHPPASSDFPNTIFSLTAVPSLNEVWLAGCPTDGDIGSAAQEAWTDSKGMYNWKAFHVNTGTYASRRIFRYQVS